MFARRRSRPRSGFCASQMWSSQASQRQQMMTNLPGGLAVPTRTLARLPWRISPVARVEIAERRRPPQHRLFIALLEGVKVAALLRGFEAYLVNHAPPRLPIGKTRLRRHQGGRDQDCEQHNSLHLEILRCGDASFFRHEVPKSRDLSISYKNVRSAASLFLFCSMQSVTKLT
jgi:hypothetical protein